MAIFHLHHRAVGMPQASQNTACEFGTAAAKARYMGRKSACQLIRTVNMIAHPRAIERQTQKAEDETPRKDGRICDTFVIALPREMSHDQRVSVTDDMLIKLTKKKGQAAAFFHEKEGDNPHIHIMLIDRDVNTGKRVFGVTERNSIEKMRQIWETTCNNHLERGGFEKRIDRRSNKARALDELEQDLPDDTNSIFDEPVEEFEFPDHVEVGETQKPLPERVADFVQARADYEYIGDAHEKLALARQDLPNTEERFLDAKKAYVNSTTSLTKAEQVKMAEREALNNHRGKFGGYKGFELTLFGKKFETPNRRLANAQKEVVIASFEEVEAKKGMVELDASKHERTKQEYDDLNNNIAKYEETLAVYGTEEEVEKALVYQQQGIEIMCDDMTLEELEEAKGTEITEEDYYTVVDYKEELARDERRSKGQAY